MYLASILTFETGLTIGAIFLLLLLSAFFSGSETALTAVSRARIVAMEQEGNDHAKQVGRLLAAPERIIGTVLIGNNLVNILASALSTSLLIGLFGDVGVAYATVVMTVLVVIFSEVLPKTYALAFPERIALAVAPAMHALIVVLKPFTMTVQFIVSTILKLTPTQKDNEANILAAHDEIRGTIEIQKQEGGVASADAAMLGGILDLKDLQVLDIMVHRTKMDTVNAADAPEKIVGEILNSQYSRVPLWRDEPDNIVGIIHTKDMLSALQRVNWDPKRLDIPAIAGPPWFVPDTTSVKDQLGQFLKRKAQLALVVDEYGEVQGLVTLEDILEEIVGQIADEHDTHEVHIRQQADGSINVEGTLPIRDLNRAMDWDLPDEEATTVAGLVMHEAQTIPEVGQTFTFYGYRFDIVRKQRNRIAAVRVRKLPAANATDPGQHTPRAR
ncbi:MAG: HlyC/CorC family transporter [Hyphomicrobiaceae bacterium]